VKELNSAKDLKNKIAQAFKNLIQRKTPAIDDNGALFSLKPTVSPTITPTKTGEIQSLVKGRTSIAAELSIAGPSGVTSSSASTAP